MFRSSLGVVVPPQSLHGHHHGHHHAAGMQGATASAAFQYQQHQYQYQPQQHQHALYSHQMNARFNGGSSAPEDDEVFRQLWYEPESEESLSALHMRLSGNGSSSSNMHSHDHLKQEAYGAEDEEEEEPVIEMPPSSTNSLLFEPLDMPKSNTSTGSFSLEQTLKDAFLNFTPEAAMSPLEKMQVSSLSYLRGPSSSSGGSRSNGNSGLYDSFRGQYDQQQHQEYNSSSSNNNISSTSSNSSLLNAILGFQTSSWASNNNNMNDTTTSSNNNNNSNSMSGYQQQSNSMRQLLLSTNPPANMNMNLLESSNNPIWISASMLSTPTSQLPAPELGRKISNKKSKARRPAKASGGRRSAVASALVLSLAGITSTANGSNDDGSSARRSGLSSPSASSVHSDTDTMSTPESGDKNAKGKKCVEPGCVRRAQSNSRCKAHGGGARCQYTGPGGCVRSSQGGGFCRAHGGGKRCEYPGCLRGQQRKGRCYVHGGIRKCQMGDCEKKDRGNGFCISHGGGKRCEHPGCSRAVRRGLLCQLHEIAS